ncbi:hypothetical protein D932_02018 [Enterococcus casseliflavus 14-MB-W-14]|nr:hypothetical protein D932_02018 [Enterococcus casseliflavus 14-MB-W-14]
MLVSKEIILPLFRFPFSCSLGKVERKRKHASMKLADFCMYRMQNLP